MPSRNEWSIGGSLFGFSGGSLSGEAYIAGGEVAVSRFGEFCFRVGDQGELLAIFPGIGVICGYDDEMSLVFVSVDVMKFMESTKVSEGKSVFDQLEDVAIIADDLEDKKQSMFLTIFPTIGKAEIEVKDAMRLVSKSELDKADFSKPFFGRIIYDEYQMDYQVEKLGDELVLMIGGQGNGVRRMVPISFANELDYMSELESKTPKRYWNLADKIVLNR